MNLPVIVSSFHSTLAQLFFLTTVSLAVFTSRSWFNAPAAVAEDGNRISLRTLCVVTLCLILGQLFLGAMMRHSAQWDEWLPTTLLVAHIGGAIIVTFGLGVSAMTALLRHRDQKFLTRPAAIALGVLFVQLMLGLAAYVTRAASPYDPQPLNPMIAVTVAHVACGALVFAATIVLTLRVFRILPVQRQTSDVRVLAAA
jgi:heme A synthase